jgi:hypothetical protein
MNQNEIVELKVLINDNEVIKTQLTMKYAEMAIKYAFENVKIIRIEDEKKLLEYENSERIASAEAPIVSAISQFETAMSEINNIE